MSKITKTLEMAASRLGAIDPEIVKLPEFADARELVRIIDGMPDPASVSAAVAKMRALKPNLFADWAAMDAAAFDSAEKVLRRGVAAPAAQPIVTKNLDASRLTDREFRELDQAVRGRGNSFDPGVLKAALVRQRAEDATLREAQ